MSEDESSKIWQELRAQSEQLRSQRDLLIEMRTKLDAVPDHELRLRRLEERRFPLQTIAVLAALASLCVAIAAYIATH